MNSVVYFNEICQLLSLLRSEVELKGSLNLHDINIFSENFYCEFLNALFSKNLVNANKLSYNEPGIDLFDDSAKVMVQILSTSTKDKIQKSLNKTDKAKYKGYHFYFISILNPVDELKEKEYQCPSEFIFNPKEDIFGLQEILNKVHYNKIDKLGKLSDICKKYLRPLVPDDKRPTALASIVEALSKESLEDSDTFNTIPFKVSDKVKFNQLDDIQSDIWEAAIFSSKLDRIYRTCESAGESPRIKIQSMLTSLYNKSNSEMSSAQLYNHTYSRYRNREGQ